MGLFDRFKSGTTATQKASDAAPVKKGMVPPVDELMREAWHLLSADQPKQAMKVYHQALKIDPSKKDMAVRRILDEAQAVSFRYKFDEAIVYVNYALKLDPKNERAYLIKQDVSRAKYIYQHIKK
jgi:tetratricopeptide (TPR) repeat protein